MSKFFTLLAHLPSETKAVATDETGATGFLAVGFDWQPRFTPSTSKVLIDIAVMKYGYKRLPAETVPADAVAKRLYDLSVAGS